MESGNADMESPIVCDNHSNDNYDLSYGKSRLFAPRPVLSTRGTGRLERSSEFGANRQSVGRRTLTHIGKTTRLRIWRQAIGGRR